MQGFWSLVQKISGPLGLILVLIAVLFDLSGNDAPRFVLWGCGGLLLIWAIASIVVENALVYVTKRLIEAAFTVFLIASLTFFLLRYLPGGPFDQERALPDEVKAAIEAKYGLNKPLFEQYVDYIAGVATMDFGISYKYIGRSVTDIISETLPISFQLGFYAMLVSFIVGIPLGVIAAARQNSLWDYSAMIVAISGVALPSFTIGPLLVLFFSFGVPLTFLHGSLPPALWETPWHYILPVLTLGLRPAAVIARMTRGSMLEVIQSDFVRTARAKGLAERIVMFRHVLKNALIPVLTISGPLAAGVMSGSFVIEIIFAVPGMGKHLVQSVTNRDYPLVIGMTLIYAVMLIMANLIVDLLYSVVDPRIRLKG